MNNYHKSIVHNLKERNKNRENQIAFESFGQKMSYKTFFEAVDNYARAYSEMGIKDKDIVTLCLAGTLDTVINFFALNEIGAIANIVNPIYMKLNPKKYINDTNSKLLVIMDRFYPSLKDSIAQTNVEKIVVSSLTEYSSFLHKMIIKRKNIKKDDKIPGVEYLSLPEFIKIGENSRLSEDIEYQNEASKPATIVYTSGSTGDPKGVVLSNDGFNNMVKIYDSKNGLGSNEGDRNLVLIPPMYGTGLVHSIIMPMAFGCNSILQPIYNPEKFYGDLRKYEPKIVVGSKTHYISLLDKKNKANSLDFLQMPFTGGEPITVSLANDINDELNHLGSEKLILGYGMSELGTMVMFNMDIKDRTNESGILLSDDIKAKIVDPITNTEVSENERGILKIYTPCHMNGYYNNSKADDEFFEIDEDGKKWANTEDIAKVDENGVYHVLGRRTDSFVDKNSEMVYLFDIENLTEKTPGVRQSEVVALTIDGEKVPVVHIVPQEKVKNKIELLNNIKNICAEELPLNHQPFAYKLRDGFETSIISGKRDYQALKYETDGYIIFDKNNKAQIVNLDTEESKVNNELAKVKKLKL